MTQKTLPLTDVRESQLERCRRILAAVPVVTTAAKLFDARGEAEAEERAHEGVSAEAPGGG